MAVYMITPPNIFLSTLIGILFKVLAPIYDPTTPPMVTGRTTLKGIELLVKYIMVLTIDRGKIMDIAVAWAL